MGSLPFIQALCKNAFMIASLNASLLYHNVGDKVGDKVGVKLNDTQRKMLELLRDNPNLTQPQLMIALGLGETAAQNNISFLRNHGFIRRIGSKKTGYWEVIADEE